MPHFIWQFIVALGIFLALDMIWLTTVARALYVSEIGGLLLPQPNIGAAIVFYLIFIAGLVYFVIGPAAAVQNLSKAFLVGAAFGFVAYATYDLTNLATLKGFTTRIALVDLAWGSFLSSAVSGLTVLALRLIRLS
jgi:uncharacterized membrane protein